MKSSVTSNEHCFESILPSVFECFVQSTLTDLVIICKNGEVKSYKLLLASVSGLIRDEFLFSSDQDALMLPDVTLEEIVKLHRCLLTKDPPEQDIYSLLEVFSLLKINLSGNFSDGTSDNSRLDVKACRPRRVVLRPKKFQNSAEMRESFPDEAQTFVSRIRQGSNHRKKSRKFECSLCRKCFSSKQALSNHELLHSDDRKFVCDICQKKFVSSGVLHNHKKLIHDSEKVKFLRCQFCSKEFSSGSNLQRHLRSRHFDHSDKKIFTCSECPKEFRDPSALASHRKIHSKLKPHCCSYCQKKFTTAAQLRVHRRTHEGIRPFSCGNCDRSFTTKGQLDSHVRHRHVGVTLPKNNLCPECGTSFVQAKDLAVHMFKHSGEMPFICDFDACGKGFRSIRNLQNHQNIHSGKKPYKCNTCGRAFAATGGLRQHFLNHEKCRVNAREGAYAARPVASDGDLRQGEQISGQQQTLVVIGDENFQRDDNVIALGEDSGYVFMQIPAVVDLSEAEGVTQHRGHV